MHKQGPYYLLLFYIYLDRYNVKERKRIKEGKGDKSTKIIKKKQRSLE
jgi:hypothetical protein